MTGRERIEAAFSPNGAAEPGAVICYENLVIRDHWEELTNCPWWYSREVDPDRQFQWRKDAAEKIGQDWFVLPVGSTHDQRHNVRIEEHHDGVYLTDHRTGLSEKLERPHVGGWMASSGIHSVKPTVFADTPANVDKAIPISAAFDPDRITRDGRGDLARLMLDRFGKEKFPIVHVTSPLWCTYNLWGFDGMMTMIAAEPELTRYACERYLTLQVRAVREAARIGAAGVWIEECLTDYVSPKAFGEINVPYLQRLAGEIRAQGMKSVYYYCGNPSDRWDHLFAAGADALSLEEGKKGWSVDIDEVACRAGGRCVVLGNLDAINLLPKAGEDELAVEIKRQIAAGRGNGGRFIMSTGSPATPGTPMSKVRLYCDLVHKGG